MREEFQIKENGFDKIKKKSFILVIPLLIIVITGILISHFNDNRESKDIDTLLFLIPIFIIIITFGFLKGIKRQRILFESYKLIITETEIIRERHNTPTISIPRNEIKSIIKNSERIIMIVGNSDEDIIEIPLQINNPEKLEQILTQIQPAIDASETSYTLKYKHILITLLTIGLIACFCISTNKIIVGIIGPMLILLSVYIYYLIRKSKHIDTKTKKGMWSIFLMLFFILGKMYFTLIGEL